MADSTVTIVGTLGNDPELRFTSGGKAFATATVAVKNRYQSQGEWQEDTSWVEFTAWGDLAENVAASCAKGNRVIVTGRLRQQEWDDKETGKKRSKLTLVADEVGASLRWARVEIERVARETNNGGD